MDAGRWQVLGLLAAALVGTLAYMMVIARRLRRLKKILDRSSQPEGASGIALQSGPQSPAALAEAAEAAKLLATKGRVGPPVGKMLGSDVSWVDDSGAGKPAEAPASLFQQPSTGAAPVSLASIAMPGKPASSPSASEGDLLKKLLSFDSPAADPAPSPAPPAAAWPEPDRLKGPASSSDTGHVPQVFGGPVRGETSSPAPLPQIFGGPPPQASPGEGSPMARLGGGADAPSSGVFGRLGAFAAPDVGAPDSAIIKPPPVIRAPAISFSNLGSAPKQPVDDSLSPRSVGGLTARLKLEEPLRDASVTNDVFGRDRGIPIGEALESESPASVKAPASDRSPLAALGLGGSGSAKPDALFGAGGRSPGPLGRLASPAANVPSGANPMGSLMSRLGGNSPPVRPGTQALGQKEESKAPVASSSPAPSSPFAALKEAAAAPTARPALAPAAGGSLLQRFGKGPTPPVEPATSPSAAAKSPSPTASPLGSLFAPKGAAAAVAASAPRPQATNPISLLAQFAKREGLGSGPPPPVVAPPDTGLPADIDSLEQLFVDDPENAGVARALAAAYLTGGRFDFASEAYGELVEKEPQEPSHRYNLGVALMRSGKNAEALECFSLLTERHKGSAWASKAIGHLLKLKSAKGGLGKARTGEKKIRFSLQSPAAGGPN